MDEYGYQLNFNMYEDEAAVMQRLYGDVLVLETPADQLLWPGYFDNNNVVSYHHQQQEEVHDQNEELMTWLGYYPPLQQTLPNHPVDPITATAAPLPPSLENPPPGSTATEYGEAPAGGSTFSMAFPSVHAGNISHVFSGGSETAPASLLPVKVTGDTSSSPEKKSVGASTSTDKADLLPVDGGRKRKIEIVEVDDDDSEDLVRAQTKRQTTQPAEPRKTRNAEMHNLTERRRRRRRTSVRFKTLFDLTPDCRKGSKNRDDRMEKVIAYAKRLMNDNEILRQRQQYREMLIASQPPNGVMYLNMPPPPAIPATPAQPAAAAGPGPGPTFPEPPPDPREYFTVSLVEYMQMKAWQMQQQAQPQPQQQNEEAGGSNSGSEDAGNHQSG